MFFRDVILLRDNEFGLGMFGLLVLLALTSVSLWLLVAALAWAAFCVWWWWKLMRDAEVCIDNVGIVERGVFLARRYVWTDTAERPVPPTRRRPHPAVALGYRMVRRQGGAFPILVVCCAGAPYPRTLRCARIGSRSTAVVTLVELADAGYPASALVPQSPKVWAADPRSGLDPRDGRFPRRLRYRVRFRFR